MHVAFFSDQHPSTLGGLQVSLGLQRDFLEMAGHTVTVCSPDSKRRPTPGHARASDVLLGSRQVGEHSFQLASPLTDRTMDAGFSRRPPVDVVHIQADVWGAWNGYRFARRHGLPVVHTMHTNIELGLPAAVPLPGVMFRLIYAAQQRYMQTPVRDMAGYLRAFADAADAVIVPSAHFAETLSRYGIGRELQVIPTGVDDRKIDSVRSESR
ncbi:MAG TPA: glycosyltransferase, partial [Candidatus Nesterenkonia stercoripullorum]|nr:glycosyltransferase [Candidatus Nesterenkonia stercoripullorum]